MIPSPFKPFKVFMHGLNPGSVVPDWYVTYNGVLVTYNGQLVTYHGAA